MKKSRRFFLFPLFLLIVYFVVQLFFYSNRLIFSLSPQATVDPENAAEIFSPSEELAVYDNKTIQPPSYLAMLAVEEQVLGDASGNKRIEIDLTNQRLYAFQDNNKVYDFLISSGKWGRTPTGTFHVWIKLRATKMEGGSKALRTYYYLPNVPYVMYFYSAAIPKYRGYGIHGTYWHNNFGHPMSHGCINMKTEEARLLYNWSFTGIPVVIYGTAPQA